MGALRCPCALNVHLLRDGFQMLRVQAGGVRAEVIKDKSFWDRPNSFLVHHAMGATQFSGGWIPYGAVASSVESAIPNPARSAVTQVGNGVPRLVQRPAPCAPLMVVANEAERLSFNKAAFPLSVGSEWRFTAASALAESRFVQWFHIGCRYARGVAFEVTRRLARDVAALGAGVLRERRFLAATAEAKPRRVRSLDPQRLALGPMTRYPLARIALLLTPAAVLVDAFSGASASASAERHLSRHLPIFAGHACGVKG